MTRYHIMECCEREKKNIKFHVHANHLSILLKCRIDQHINSWVLVEWKLDLSEKACWEHNLISNVGGGSRASFVGTRPRQSHMALNLEGPLACFTALQLAC